MYLLYSWVFSLFFFYKRVWSGEIFLWTGLVKSATYNIWWFMMQLCEMFGAAGQSPVITSSQATCSPLSVFLALCLRWTSTVWACKHDSTWPYGSQKKGHNYRWPAVLVAVYGGRLFDRKAQTQIMTTFFMKLLLASSLPLWMGNFFVSLSGTGGSSSACFFLAPAHSLHLVAFIW